MDILTFLFVYFFDNCWWQWSMHLATQEIDFAITLHLLQWTLRGSRANWDGKFRMYTLTWTAFLYKNVKKNKFSWLFFLVYFKIMHYHNILQYTVVYHTVQYVCNCLTAHLSVEGNYLLEQKCENRVVLFFYMFCLLNFNFMRL